MGDTVDIYYEDDGSGRQQIELVPLAGILACSAHCSRSKLSEATYSILAGIPLASISNFVYNDQTACFIDGHKFAVQTCCLDTPGYLSVQAATFTTWSLPMAEMVAPTGFLASLVQKIA